MSIHLQVDIVTTQFNSTRIFSSLGVPADLRMAKSRISCCAQWCCGNGCVFESS